MARKRYQIEIRGRSYTVEVEDPTVSPAVVRVNGEEFRVTWQDASPEPAEGVGERTGREPAPPQALAGDMSVREVKAPMPGTILDVQVRPGDEVAFQQELCSLEAMKMKNSIRSPRAGRITKVEVVEGQSVAYGETLFVFE